MTLEAATYVSGLNASAPGAADPRNQGDDHLRLIKAVLQASFPNSSAPFYIPTVADPSTSTLVVATPTDGGKTFPVDCSSGAVQVDLPSDEPFDGFYIKVVKADFSINAVTISGNGRTINGVSSISLIKGFHTAILEYSTSLSAWLAYVTQATPSGSFLDSAATSIPGYLLCDGTSTIGDGSSGATNTGPQYLTLFQVLWNGFGNAVCPVSSGRGTSAAADFAAHKKLTLPDLRGRARFGKDNMGGSAAGRITTAVSIDGSTLGTSGGSQSVVLTQANLPNVSQSFSGTISGTAASAGAHSHTLTSDDSKTGSESAGIGGNFYTSSGDSGSRGPASQPTSTYGAHTHSVSGSCSGNVALNGGVTQTAVSILPPAFIVNTFVAV